MPGWVWMVIAALVVVAVVVLVGRRTRSRHVKERFGPEYERTVAAAGGDAVAAEKELLAREHRRDELDVRALSPAARNEFSRRWHGVQSAFVDDPSGALGEADRLVSEVMAERGYPVDFDRRAADVSVDHPTLVENYRAAQTISQSQHGGEVGTESQRQAFVHYRALFDQLLAPDDDHDDDDHGGNPNRHHDADAHPTARHTTTTEETPA
jgi:hypothetical protein